MSNGLADQPIMQSQTPGISTIAIQASDVETARKFLAFITCEDIGKLLKDNAEIKITFDRTFDGTNLNNNSQ